MIIIRTALLLLLVVFPILCSAQKSASDKIKPQWIHKLPKPTNSTFTYVIKTASAETLDHAREKCLAEVVSHAGFKKGVVVISESHSEEHVSQEFNNGRLTETINYDNKTTTSAKATPVKLYVENVAEYWERDKIGHYYLTKLYAVSQMEYPPLFDDVEISYKYGMQGFIRSIVPGWGQMYKGSTAKGLSIMGGEIAFAIGILASENTRASYVKKMYEQPEYAEHYNSMADSWANYRNVCIGGAAALYVYNLIDALVANGAGRVIVKKRQYFSMNPMFTNEGSGLTLYFTF